MYLENIDVALSLPRDLWEALLERAQTEHEHETMLLVRAMEQYLQ